MAIVVSFTGKAPLPSGDTALRLWSYRIDPSPPGEIPAGLSIALGLPRDVDVRNPALYPEIPELQGTFLLRVPNSTRQYVGRQAQPAGTQTISFVAPVAESSSEVILVKMPAAQPVTPLAFATSPTGTQAPVQVMTAPIPGRPAFNGRPLSDFKGSLPYASEVFGVYQPLAGWFGTQNTLWALSPQPRRPGTIPRTYQHCRGRGPPAAAGGCACGTRRRMHGAAGCAVGRGVLRLAHDCPAHYVLFDLLADVDGRVILDLPLSQRRARLESLLADVPAQLTLTPQTADMRQVGDWLMHWTVAAGIEGVVSKRLGGRYLPGRRGWSKYRTRIVTEAIIGGVTGSLCEADTLLLGRFDRSGRLRYTGRTHPLNVEGRREFEAVLSPPRFGRHRRAAVVHPWPQPLPASWSGQWDRPEPLEYVQVEPTVVVEIEADVAFEHQRWRHRVRAVRARPDMSVYDVPLLLGEQEGYFGET
ncbi:hypothetical protein [Micromonospora sp. NPDC002717]|uniref:ATP-dependent DNA ligase n=1 Tax=Micromonospora sp. NPDC002717 TaxID=3154424 RepID=UPI003327E7A6